MEPVGLIPCAGKGSRLSLPFSKELFPNVHTTSYSPILMYTINAMKEAGIRHLVITVNPDKSDIIKFLGNGSKWGVTLSYCVHAQPRSLPESIDEAYHLIVDKTVAFAMPDTYVQPANFLRKLVISHREDPTREVTLGCFQTDNPSKFGMVDFVEDSGKVLAVYDKPASSTLQWMWGAMVWNPSFAESIHQFVKQKNAGNSSSKELILSDALASLIEQRKVNAHRFHHGRYRDLGTYDEIRLWSKNE
ncbi:sugar phosphate nucleotidyltransferase [Paenibacillus beijingensis]|uniref:Glucose-1-phosphate thymidylyltransferase n=1 Tax=Paenibacillus beijingensis TaxID=1126833 RepID=A0A0D5NNJ2_9BACL|nr:sugar phosphate nucleotidyltransferase [Paenibacillus beijingensis]AJY76710.1 hypothetical protein VN24_21730 [Paenibacillus beijingensis]